MTVAAAMWAAYLAALSLDAQRPRAYSAWAFGDSAEMADELGGLVRSGRKTATCSLLWEYEADGEAVPQVGEYSVILGGDAQPLCIIETVEVTIRPYDSIDADFAADEGEGDLSLDYWRAAHWSFFSRSCARIGRTPTLAMPLVCERFVVRYP